MSIRQFDIELRYSEHLFHHLQLRLFCLRYGNLEQVSCITFVQFYPPASNRSIAMAGCCRTFAAYERTVWLNAVAVVELIVWLSAVIFDIVFDLSSRDLERLVRY